LFFFILGLIYHLGFTWFRFLFTCRVFNFTCNSKMNFYWWVFQIMFNLEILNMILLKIKMLS